MPQLIPTPLHPDHIQALFFLHWYSECPLQAYASMHPCPKSCQPFYMHLEQRLCSFVMGAYSLQQPQSVLCLTHHPFASQLLVSACNNDHYNNTTSHDGNGHLVSAHCSDWNVLYGRSPLILHSCVHMSIFHHKPQITKNPRHSYLLLDSCCKPSSAICPDAIAQCPAVRRLPHLSTNMSCM